MLVSIVLVEILAVIALAIGAFAFSHLVFWLLERFAAWEQRHGTPTARRRPR